MEKRKQNCEEDSNESFLGFSDTKTVSRDVRPSKQSKIVCKFYAAGYCGRGQSCIFVHEATASAIVVSSASTAASSDMITNATTTTTTDMDVKIDKLCRYFMLGRCRNNACLFVHSLPKAIVSREKDVVLIPSEESKVIAEKAKSTVSTEQIDCFTVAATDASPLENPMIKAAKVILQSKSMKALVGRVAKGTVTASTGEGIQ